MRSKRMFIGLAFAAVYLIWGSTFFAIRIAVQQVPPLLLAGNRFVLAGAVVLAWALARGVRWRALPWRAAVVPGLLFFAAANGAVCWAESRGLPSGTAAMLIASEPLWVALLVRVMNRSEPRLRTAQRIGLVGGFFGTTLLVGATPQGVEPLAAAVVLVGAGAWALGSVLVGRRARRPDRSPADPVALAGMQMLIGGVACLLASRALGEPMVGPLGLGTDTIGAFAYLVVFGSIIGFLAYSYLLRNVAPARAATYAYANPVVAVVLGTMAGEAIDAPTLVAMGLVITSVVLTVSPPRRRRRAPSPPVGRAPVPCRR